jgi:glycosyltransferase involved in cell wall biosynthesis
VRVLHFLHYARGGIVTVVLTQITQSTDSAIDYHLAVLEHSDDLVREAQRLGVRLHVLGSSLPGLPWRYHRLLRAVQPDLVHTHSYVPRVLTAAATLTGGGFARVSTVHNDYPYFHSATLRSRFKRSSEALCLRSGGTLTICGSEQVRTVVASLYRVPPARLRRIHNGITIRTPGPTAAGVTAAAGGPVVVTVGRVSEQKNYAMLIDCWRDVSSRVPEALLWIVGDGEQRTMLEARARAYGLTSVKFWGWQSAEDVAAILSRADLFVLSSLHESLPTAMLEAFGAGLPVVTTRVAGADEVIEPGINGHIVDDAAGLTRALETMLALPSAERTAMGARGRERVLRDFTAARFVRDVEQTYRECLA